MANNNVDNIIRINNIKCGYTYINTGYLIYTRKVFVNHQAKLFFMLVIVSFAIKYFMLAQYSSGTNMMF